MPGQAAAPAMPGSEPAAPAAPAAPAPDPDSPTGGVGLTIVELGENGVLLRVRGELDVATAPLLETMIDDLATTGGPISVDLSAVTFADAAAFNVLICACVLPRTDAEVHIVASCPAIHRLVELAFEAMNDV
jgi:anti-anti-sigma factor